MITIDNSKEKLIKHNIKPSVQRLAVLNYLENHLVHPTVDDIFRELSPSMPTLSKTTIYNTLTLLLQHGVVQAINIDEKNVRYDGNNEPHAHFKCIHCQRIFDVPSPLVSKPELCEGFELKEVQVYYAGICKDCKHK